MNRQEFDSTVFFFGIQARVGGIWYKVASVDFANRVIELQGLSPSWSIYPAEHIEEFSTLTATIEGR